MYIKEITLIILLRSERAILHLRKNLRISLRVGNTLFMYGAPFVNLLFNLFLEDFLVIYYLIYDN